MNQEINSQADIKQQALEAQSLPELQSAFEAIEKLKDNPNAEITLDEYGAPVKEEEEVTTEQDEEEEELEESLPEEEEELEEVTPKKAVKEKKADTFRKLQKDKYRALAEKEEALQRLAQMEELMNESLNSGTYHYSKNIYAELDKAKENKRRAFEEGDFDAYLEADVALIKSVNAINDLERWANENEPQQNSRNNYQEPNPSYSEELYQEIAKDWMDSHPYLKPNSRSYNSKLAGEVTEFINELDDNLYRNRQQDAIFSEEYFDTIDNYIQSRNTPRRNSSKNIESLSNVSGVRNSSSSGNGKSSSSTQMILSKEEKIMAERAGISPKDWLKYKIEDSQNKR